MRLTKSENDLIKHRRNKTIRNILVVGDLHCPFDLDEYLPHCIEQYKKWNCNQVIMIGDKGDVFYEHPIEANYEN